MDYDFEKLGDERFQKLCQALLVSAFPNVQCLPVGQPDGGRDALQRHDGGFVTYQVKYSRMPGLKAERESINDLIASEAVKVERLIQRGATSYYLLTNVAGTSHLGVGSIDRINEALTTKFGIPSFCWWRDDLERRIDTTPGLIWRYPEMMHGSDFLEALSSGNLAIFNHQKIDVFRSYMATQLGRDSEVKFQQVQIQNSLLDLFTDTPLALAREKQPNPDSIGLPPEAFRMIEGTFQPTNPFHAVRSGTVLAADWLLKAAPEAGVQRIVLEGAPGQGKSTVTQYLCQLHRIRALNKPLSDKIPRYHLDAALRLPMRVDLRDYAAWLSGYDPFAPSKHVDRPVGAVDGLESFLAHQVRNFAAGRDFSADDLIGVLADAHCLLVMDGFDEVTDIPTRSKLIEQLKAASGRLENAALSVQIIVTSRPAFILSPGFSEREWSHYSLSPMQNEQIS